jgi:hypothetical protein
MSVGIQQHTIQELLRDLPYSYAELARRSKVTEKTLIRLREGEKVRRLSAVKVLKALSEIYGQKLTLANVEGINLDD